MKRSILTIIAITFIVSYSFGQDYRTGIGVRLGGYTSGITVRHFVNSNSAIEGILGFSHSATVITGLYERHNLINNAPGLTWFYGGGGHLGFFRYDEGYYFTPHHGHFYYYYADYPGESNVVGGIDFILGLDYKFNGAPINIGLDIKPFIDFFDGVQGYFDGAFSFRFVF
jgi:hypothetical protein